MIPSIGQKLQMRMNMSTVRNEFSISNEYLFWWPIKLYPNDTLKHSNYLIYSIAESKLDLRFLYLNALK